MRYSLRVILIVVVLAALVSLAAAKILKVRQAAIRNSRAYAYRQIALSLWNYESAFGHIPVPTRFDPGDPESALFSWRLRILPFYASYKMDIDQNLSWDAPANLKWRGISQPFAEGGWGDGAWDKRNPGDIPTETAIYGITGPGTVFGDGKTHRSRSMELAPNDTIILAEIANAGHHWMAPGDFDILTMSRIINSRNGDSISGNYDGGFFIAFADTQVWFMSNSTPFSSLSKFFTVEGATQFDRDIELGAHRIE